MKLVAHDTSRDEIVNQHGLQYQIQQYAILFPKIATFHMRYPSELIDFVTSGYATSLLPCQERKAGKNFCQNLEFTIMLNFRYTSKNSFDVYVCMCEVFDIHLAQ